MNKRRTRNVIIEHGFEANYSVGFSRGLASCGVPFTCISSNETEARLSTAGIDNRNLRGSLSKERPSLVKSVTLIRYYLLLLLYLFSREINTVHFIGIFRKEFILFEGLFLNVCFRVAARQYVYTAHNILPHNEERNPFLRAVFRWVYKIPHLLVVHSEAARQQLINEFRVPKRSIRVIPIGLNEEIPVTKLSREDARARLGLTSADRIILFFGTIDEYKGLDILIAAFSKLTTPDTKLLIAGSFRGASYRRQILEDIEKCSRSEHVVLREGRIPNEEVEVFFKASDVICLPYRNIYQSGLLSLAPRFGVPIVAMDVGSLREIEAAGLGIVASRNDAHGLVKALYEFFDTPSRFSYDKIREKARRSSWVYICRSLTDLF